MNRTECSIPTTSISRRNLRLGTETMKIRLLVVVMLLSSVTPAIAQYIFTSIDDPTAQATSIRGINNHGEIVGAYRKGPLRHALLIKDGQFVPLDPTSILGTNFSETKAIGNCF